MLRAILYMALIVLPVFCLADETQGGSSDYIPDYGIGSSIKINFGALDIEPEVGSRLSNNPDIRGSEEAIQKAINFYQQHRNGINCNGYQKGKKLEKPIIVVNDFTKPQNEKRQFLINMETGDITATYTSHGYGSNDMSKCPPEHKIGPSNCAIPTTFTNYCNQGTTLSGFFRVGAGYRSQESSFNKGPPDLAAGEENAVRLHGVEDEKNETAAECGKVWHSSQYTEGLKNPGSKSNSAGCPTVPPDIFRKFRDAIKDGALMYNHTIMEEKMGTPACQPSKY